MGKQCFAFSSIDCVLRAVFGSNFFLLWNRRNSPSGIWARGSCEIIVSEGGTLGGVFWEEWRPNRRRRGAIDSSQGARDGFDPLLARLVVEIFHPPFWDCIVL